MIGFTTANRIPSGCEEELLHLSAIPEHVINRAFLAADRSRTGSNLKFHDGCKTDTWKKGRVVLQPCRIP